MKLLAALFFAATLAVAQTPAPTQVTVYHYSSPSCNVILSLIFPAECLPNVTVEATSADPNVLGYIIVIGYTDENGKSASAVATTIQRFVTGSPVFYVTFPGTAKATNITAFAFPLISAGLNTGGSAQIP